MEIPMKTNGWVVLGAFVITFLLGAFISKIVGDKKLDRLKFVADSVVTVSRQDSTAAIHFSDSIKVVVSDLQTKKNRVIRIAVVDSQAVDSLKDELKTLPTLRDSVNNLINTVAVQDSQIQAERSARIFAEAQTEAQGHRADSLQVWGTNEHNRVTFLENQIRGLHPRLPKLVRYGIEGVKLVGVFFAGTQYERNRNK